jgi:glycosyltransferase involved in cell wall biosynthesis
MSERQPRVLYISYDGMLEALGQSQVLPYLRGLAGRGAAITLLSFEKAPARKRSQDVSALRASLAAQGIEWVSRAYHKRPLLPATLFDVLNGLLIALALGRTRRFQIVHARSHVAAVIAWLLKGLLGTRFIFDLRGFLADERLEGGLWSERSLPYRLVKGMEQKFLSDADEVITLTERARELLRDWPGGGPRSVTVIPTCVDLARFPSLGSSIPLGGRAPVLAYAGSLGTVYELDAMLRFFLCLRRRLPEARLLMLTSFRNELDSALRRIPVPAAALAVDFVPPGQVGERLAGCDAGLIFCKPGLGRLASCPTKVAEYLALGLPVVINDAIGDARQLIGDNGVGVVLSDFQESSCEKAADQLMDLWKDRELAARCRRVAEQSLSLDLGVDRYWVLYSKLA